ncbi:OmpA family protein [Flagellimonas nanhaiensis]|uniref:Cell envelope biogenesis protein OmpA n=1 Tax=Flagellimonas nanhaiensis TaxID=2292706 RepID=A0A371JQN5_9FLAO|nr:OmpA family protein [Allomuricauda nanhaiensis]RDY59819.1 cell envelope biogenesis protein OmpA [Allomuricauda nanhaiensis]
MKRLILISLLLISLGIKSQEVTLLDFSDDETHLTSSNDEGGTAVNNSYIKHLEGLSNRKLMQYVRKKGVTAKLIRMADEYFDKMWYAEAARVYDIVLEKTEADHSYRLLSQAGDSHYYSGNLEKSFKWYHELYETYKNEITEDKFFRYAHALKGTGRYRRAAKLTQLFQEKNGVPSNKRALAGDDWKGPALVEIKNMAINSKYSDFSPMFHKDSSIVFASAHDSAFITTRRYRWTNQPFLDLYVADAKNEGEDLTNPKKFSKTINTKYHEASVAFSPDEKTIYFTRNNYGKRLKRGKNGINHLKIYRSNFVDGDWTEAVEVPFNSEDYSTGHPSISPDGKKLYFVSDRPGGYGETDIYVVDILDNGNFTEPKNLGRTVNTSKKEMFPYITEDALYFSSNRSMGMGGLDIYKADHAEGIFGVGINLGEPINSNRDDFSYIIDTRGEKGYFASNRKGGRGDDDIYSFKYLQNLNAISGVIEDVTNGETVADAQVLLFDKDKIQVAEARTSADGKFVFKELMPKSKYTIRTVKKGYFEANSPVMTKSNVGVEITQSIKPLEEIIVEDKGILKLETETIYFDFDRFNIRPEAARELDKLVAVMTEYKNMVIKIESHTDAIGKKAYNQYLSDKRAKSTRAYLISKGIDPSRIESAIGYGEERLLNNCSDGNRCPRSKHQENRRSEFIIVSQ